MTKTMSIYLFVFKKLEVWNRDDGEQSSDLLWRKKLYLCVYSINIKLVCLQLRQLYIAIEDEVRERCLLNDCFLKSNCSYTTNFGELGHRQ